MRILGLLVCCAAAVVLNGCAGYHLGPVNGGKAGEKTIEVLPFSNQTLEPRLGDALMRALRERLQADGTYRLVTAKRGDVVVSGTILDYHREPLGYLSSDSTTADSFRVGVTVHVVVRNSNTGKALLDRDVKGHTLVNVGSDLASAERQARTLLADDVAKNIAELLTEGTW